MKNSPLEHGLHGAFRLFVVIRLLLWLLLRNGVALITGRSEINAVDTQTFMIIFLLDGFVLVALSWPRLRGRISSRTFALLLILSSGALLLGNANTFALRDPDILNSAPFFTRYSILLFTTLVFVAWQYNLQAVGLFSVVVTAAQLFALWQVDYLTVELFVLIVTAMLLTFLLPGWLITGMMTQQRQQRVALAAAAEEQARTNEKLVHYMASLEELTISRERNRLARELHDTLAHSLSAVTVQLGAVEALWEQNPDTARDLLAQADSSARDGLHEARRALQALRASPLEDLGLVLALEALAQDAAARAGATLHLSLPEDNLSALAPYIEQSLYRVAQEALENCARHAQAHHIWVTLTYAPANQDAETIQLIVRDDGQGFDEARTATKSENRGRYGVAGMAERAEVSGGTLTIESAKGAGTTVQLNVPIKQTAPYQENRS